MLLISHCGLVMNKTADPDHALSRTKALKNDTLLTSTALGISVYVSN